MDGVWRRTAWLIQPGDEVQATRVRRVRRVMGLDASSPTPQVSRAAAAQRVDPDVRIDVGLASADHGGSAERPAIRLRPGCVFVVAIMDGYRRDVFAWAVSVTLASRVGLAALERAFRVTPPTSVKPDHGGPCTSPACTGRFVADGGPIRRDRRGRVLEHSCGERRWRRVTYEAGAWPDYPDVQDSITGWGGDVACDNHERLHPALHERPPAVVYRPGNAGAATTPGN